MSGGRVRNYLARDGVLGREECGIDENVSNGEKVIWVFFCAVFCFVCWNSVYGDSILAFGVCFDRFVLADAYVWCLFYCHNF